MRAHAIAAQGAIGSRRDHDDRAVMQPPIVLCGGLGRCPPPRNTTVAPAQMRLGNSLFHQRIRESLTTISLIILTKGFPPGVHVDRNFSGQRISAVKPLLAPLGASGNEGEERTGD